MLKAFLSDLHIHTCLSPCAGIEMLPRTIVAKAKDAGLHAIGITDHNSAENVLSVKKAGEKAGLSVMMGMEITSQEEVHLLAFFASERDLFAMQELIYQNLPGENDEEIFGQQIVVDEESEPCGFNERRLIGTTTLSLEDIVEAIHALGGLAVASHIDREAFGILGQLGFIPQGMTFDALEVSRPGFKDIPTGFPLVVFSDAHSLDDIGRNATRFLVEGMTIGEMKKALEGSDGRSVAPYFGHR